MHSHYFACVLVEALMRHGLNGPTRERATVHDVLQKSVKQSNFNENIYLHTVYIGFFLHGISPVHHMEAILTCLFCTLKYVMK